MSKVLEMVQEDTNSNSSSEEEGSNVGHTTGLGLCAPIPQQSMPVAKKQHLKGLARLCGKKVPWFEEEKSAPLENFSTYLDKHKLPSINDLSNAVANIPQLENRSPSSIKSWLESECNSVQHSSPSTNNEEKIRRTKWSAVMKESLLKHFSDHVEYGTLPTNKECADFTNQTPSFQSHTAASVRTAVYNERRRCISF